MKKTYYALSVITIFVSCYADYMDNHNECKRKCATSNAETTGQLASCEQGCEKFFSLAESNDRTEEENYNVCIEGCVDNLIPERCECGCHCGQRLFASMKEPEDDEGIKVHTLRAIGQMRKVMTIVQEHMKIIRSWIVTFFLKDEEEMVSVQVPGPTVVELFIENDEEVEPKETEQKSFQHQLVDSSRRTVEKISLKLGVPPFVVIFTFVSVLVFLLYALFALVSSIICEKRKKKNDLVAVPIPGKCLPANLVRPEDLTKLSLIDEEELPYEADELPQKVKLPEYSIV